MTEKLYEWYKYYSKKINILDDYVLKCNILDDYMTNQNLNSDL